MTDPKKPGINPRQHPQQMDGRGRPVGRPAEETTAMSSLHTAETLPQQRSVSQERADDSVSRNMTQGEREILGAIKTLSTNQHKLGQHVEDIAGRLSSVESTVASIRSPSIIPIPTASGDVMLPGLRPRSVSVTNETDDEDDDEDMPAFSGSLQTEVVLLRRDLRKVLKTGNKKTDTQTAKLYVSAVLTALATITGAYVTTRQSAKSGAEEGAKQGVLEAPAKVMPVAVPVPVPTEAGHQ